MDLEEKKLNWRKLLNIGPKVQYYVPNADGITRVKKKKHKVFSKSREKAF